MNKRLGRLDTFELDDLLDAGTPAIDLVGRRVLWHGHYTGTVVLLASGRIAIRFRIRCQRCGVRGPTVHVTSGCHPGAFCYVSDPTTGALLADLRNQVVVCKNCANT